MSVRVTACRSFALSGRLCACPAAWGKGGGASVGRRGGTEALGRTAPPWLPVGLGTGQVSGRMGAQGPGWAAPRPTGGSEARGPRGSGWRRVRKPDTSGPHGPEQRTGSGEARFAERSRAWRGPGWEGTETSAPLSPPPRPRTHARTPGMPLGVLEALRAAEPGQAFAGHGAAVFGGVAALAGRSLVAGPSAQVQRAPPGRGAAGWPDRQVRAKGRRSAGLLGRPAAAASVYGHTTLNAPDLV